MHLFTLHSRVHVFEASCFLWSVEGATSDFQLLAGPTV